ncbi:MAG: oxidative damage protection protein [Methylococcaceae bacterium]|nr:oxidative damage protection protein [Methylococcaceae bacterium]MDP3902510.1 oxidative damage protection protein [Methylococcaceae bacterium]
MTRTVHCVKLGITAEGLDEPPFPGPKGQEIFDKVSKQAWKEWLAKQTMLINEGKLASFDPKARAYLAEERSKFLFEGNTEMPEGYVPQK